MSLPPIPRPDGSIYRPRKIRSQTLADGCDGEPTSIVVFGTKDVREAEAVARLDVKAVDSEFYDEFIELAIVGEPRERWLSRSLAGWDEDRPLYVFTESERGAYALEWQVREQDRIRDPEQPDGQLHQETSLFDLGNAS